MRSMIGRIGLMVCASTTTWLAAAPSTALDVVPRHYAMFQDGYSEGAVVTGAFSGSDLDGNGILVHFPLADGEPAPPIELLELTAFSAHFSGNALSPAFDLTLDDLYGFVYELGTNGIGDDPAFEPTLGVNLIEGVGAIGAAHFYTSGLGPNGFIGGYIGGQIDGFPDPPTLEDVALDSSPNLLRVTAVPEPAAGLLAAAVALFAAASRVGRKADCR